MSHRDRFKSHFTIKAVLLTISYRNVQFKFSALDILEATFKIKMKNNAHYLENVWTSTFIFFSIEKR